MEYRLWQGPQLGNEGTKIPEAAEFGGLPSVSVGDSILDRYCNEVSTPLREHGAEIGLLSACTTRRKEEGRKYCLFRPGR